jgi:hypothetical protein
MWLTKSLNGLLPADESSREAYKKFKVGETYRGDVVKPRSYQHHKLCMALLNMTYENQERYTSFEHFRKAVAIAAGHVDELITLDGEVMLQPRSISYAELDEVEFGEVMAEMMKVCGEILYGLKMAELDDKTMQVHMENLRQEVLRYADGHYGR